MTSATGWSTEKEIEYLNTIGDRKFGVDTQVPVNSVHSKRDLLAGYLRGAKQRKDWGVMWQSKVIEHAEYLLALEINK